MKRYEKLFYEGAVQFKVGISMHISQQVRSDEPVCKVSRQSVSKAVQKKPMRNGICCGYLELRLLYRWLICSVAFLIRLVSSSWQTAISFCVSWLNSSTCCLYWCSSAWYACNQHNTCHTSTRTRLLFQIMNQFR